MSYLSRNEKMLKLKDKRTFNWGIPAFRSRSGFMTCPKAGACAAGCYARGGWYTHRPVVLDAYERRLALALSPQFVPTISRKIKFQRVERLRIHDSGDFFSVKYLEDWLQIIHGFPNVQFYTYTKMVSLFKRYQSEDRIPENFTVVFSYGGLEDRLIDPARDRHCRVFENEFTLFNARYEDASDDDRVAIRPDVRRVGIIYHGQKHYENTSWGRVSA